MTEVDGLCCFDWAKYMPILEGQQVLADSHNMKFPERGIFRFCPWCGEQRNTDHQMAYEKVFERMNPSDAHIYNKMRENSV